MTALDRAPLLFIQAAHASFKDRVRFTLRNPDDAAVRARYGARMAFLRHMPVNAALVRVNQWLAIEQKAYQVACAFGRGNRLGLVVLHELRLILRFARIKNLSVIERAA